MATTREIGHPLFVPDANREIANERAAKLVDTISDYLAVKDTIPTGFTQRDQILENRARILDVLGGTEADWNDWHWHIRNGINTVDALSKIIDLTDEEVADFDKTADLYRWKISPYYASLMDPKDHRCPIRMQAVPSGLEYFDREEETDPYASVFNSPAPLITRLYADRLIINATNICSVFCRHCLRKKDIAQKDMIYHEQDFRAALDYIAGCPEVRDVLITGGDALMLSNITLDWLLGELEKIPHVEMMRLGSRMIATLPMRVDDGLVEILEKRRKPVYLNTQLNHPLEVTPEAEEAVLRLMKAGVMVSNQSVLLKNINHNVHVMKKLVHELMKIRVRPYYIFNCKKLQGIRHFRASVQDGLNIMENLRGYTSGLAVPTFIITAPEGKGKTPILPTYLLNPNRNGKLLFRTWGGQVCEYDDELPDED